MSHWQSGASLPRIGCLAVAFAVAALPSSVRAQLYDGEHFQLSPYAAIVGDYTFFGQDETSRTLFGVQEDTQDLRATRIGAILRTQSDRPWVFNFAADYQEARTREDRLFRLYDLRLRIPAGPIDIEVGKQKQPFTQEIAGLSILKPFQERILAPFFVTRSNGVRVSGQAAGDRMTWALAWFNDWLEQDATFAESANDVAARVTGLVSVSEDDRDFLHLGLGLRRAGPDVGTLQLSGRPESNVADRHIDTGEFPAEYGAELGIEVMWNRGPMLVTGEHVEMWVEAPERASPRFRGSYLMLSWMVTGESRPYDRGAGTTAPFAPVPLPGPVELVVRYSYLDVTDGPVDGGVLGKWHFGANWWFAPKWKAGVSYGDARTTRDGMTGTTRMFLTRIQWLHS